MRVSGRYNKHKSFYLRKKYAAVNENEVKKIKIQIHDLIYVMQQGSPLLMAGLQTNCMLK